MSITRNGSIMVQGASASGILSGTYGGTGANLTPTTAGNTIFTTDGTNWSSTQKIVRGTTVATTSGTSIDITGIPSWVKRVTLMVNGISMSSATPYGIIQIGSGSITTSGYVGTMCTAIHVSPTGAFAFTNSFGFINFGAAADTQSGIFVLTSLGSNLWVAAGTFTTSGSSLRGTVTSGTITLGGALDRIRLTTSDGTTTFDAGSVNILYE
jgi:hypothetical protein